MKMNRSAVIGIILLATGILLHLLGQIVGVK